MIARARWLTALVAVGAASVGIGGCSTGSGTGDAAGPLWILNCKDGNDFGTPAAPVRYDMHTAFFAGQPVSVGTSDDAVNQLLLLMQHNGSQTTVDDTLTFDLKDELEVARCVRGRTVNGQPDWRVTETNAAGVAVPWCDWTGTAFGNDGGVDAGDAGTAAIDDGGMSVMATAPRIHVTPDTDLRVSFTPFFTCPPAVVVADGLDGFVQLTDFGGAAQPDVPPEMRDPVPASFAVGFGDRVAATFDVTLIDDQIISAQRGNQPPPETPQIGGTLSGSFNFVIDRGRAAQPFP